MLQRVFELDADESQKAAFALTKDAAFSEDQGLVQIASDLLDQEETLAGIADTMMVFTRAHGALIDSGRLSSAAELLRALSAARKRFAQSQPLWEKKIGEAVTSICSRERLGHLSDSLNQRPEISSEQLKDYLSCFDWTTYAALSVLLGALEHEEHRFALCEFLSQIDKQHIDLIASGMYDKRWHVVRDTAMILGHFDTTRAHKHLIKAFDHPDRRVRLEVVSCASSHRVEFVRQVALAGIRDEDGEIQDMALDMALKQSGENAFILFTELVKEIGLDKLPASATEKALLGYSLGGQERAVPLLVKLAGSRGLFKRTPAHYRREAMQALARNSAAEAEAALKKMSRSWNNDVRMLARAALDERNEESTGAGPAA
ncbi:MAG: HEAT repeat domain-containing protein [Candidatus Zixiibacteriota bacterium]